ncbi:PAS domain-containing protein [Fodinicurvata fenggangensis]|uniref:PAS domain-containing protein n=1 Tax=Fodinicurvata fenggangensis TaxID=1121830 RepID=UPI00068A9149|nr:PAS domain-containing protein [Fodinicurvata fenggangensis]
MTDQENGALHQRQLEDLIASIDGVVWEADPDSLQYTFVSAKIEDILGYPREQWTDEPDFWVRHLHPEDAEHILALSKSEISKGQSYQLEYRMIAADGRTIWLHDLVSFYENQGKTWLHGLMIDVTRQHEVRETLQKERRTSELILNSIADAVLVLDAGGFVLKQNPAAFTLLGWEDSAMVGQHSHRLVHHSRMDGSPYPEEDCPIYKTLEDAVSRRSEGEVFFRRDNRPVTVDFTVAPLIDERDAVTGAVVSFRDVTQKDRFRRATQLEKEILQQVSEGTELNAVMENMLLRVESLMPGTLASIILLDDDEHHVRPGAAPSLPGSYIQTLDGVEIGPSVGSCGTAMYLGERVIVTDIENDPLWADFRPLALANGLRACWSTPIRSANGRILASFSLYYREPRAPNTSDLDLIDRLSNLTSVMIERTRALEALRKSEEKFRELAENIEEVFWISNPAGDVLHYISPAFETIWGRSRESVYEDPMLWLEAIHEEDRDHVAHTLRGQANEGFTSEYRVIRPDGSLCWISDKGTMIRDAQGQVLRVMGTARDVTRRKQAELALRESEQRFQAISSAVSDVLWDWDLRTGRLWWSPDVQKLLGCSPEDLDTPEKWGQWLHSDDRARVQYDVQQAIRDRQKFWESEYRLLRKDGETLHVEDHASLIPDSEGTPIRLVGGMSDVTERKHHQMQLRERIKELRCLYRVLEVTSDPLQPIETVCEQIVEVLPESLLHTDISVARIELEENHYKSPGWSQPAHSLRGTIESNDQVMGIVEVGYREIRHTGFGQNELFSSEEGEMVQAVASHIGRMLENRRLSERLSQSERLKAIGELTGGVAHDFNNLLTVILGNTEAMTAALPKDHELHPLVEMTQTAAERSADLTQHLLAFARQQPLSPEPTDVASLVQDMSGLLRRTLGEHIQIDILAGNTVWKALVDPVQLESAVLNLCINARDAMPERGHLTIEVQNVHLDKGYGQGDERIPPGPYVMLAISDTGNGMPSDVVARAFDPFFTTKETGKGSGLGLSMVYGFARQSRGQAVIYSEEGQGTTVKLYLPRGFSDPENERASTETDEITGGPERILVVEDDDLVRGHVIGQLESLGYRVVSAENGTQALKILEREADLDLLFTDVIMPGGLNGGELAEKARELHPNLPVLFTSGYTDSAIVHHGQVDPGVHLLTKPYRRQALAEKLREVLAENAPPRT